jgi:hypothetical protein
MEILAVFGFQDDAITGALRPIRLLNNLWRKLLRFQIDVDVGNIVCGRRAPLLVQF